MPAYNNDFLAMERAYLRARQRDISHEVLASGVAAAIIEADMPCPSPVKLFVNPTAEDRLYVPSILLAVDEESERQLLGLTAVSSGPSVSCTIDEFYPVGVIHNDGEFYALQFQDADAAQIVHNAALGLVMDRDEVLPHLSADLLRIEANPTLL